MNLVVGACFADGRVIELHRHHKSNRSYRAVGAMSESF